MGIFSKTNKKSKLGNGTTVISNGTIIKGGIDTEGSVFIDGKFEGVIVAATSVVIGKSGEVLGEIRTKTLSVNGLADGVFDVKDINILSSGKVIGKLQYEDMIIEHNGTFEGKSKKKNSTLTSKYNIISHTPKEQIEK